MGTLEIFLILMSIISGGLLAWTFTKQGKEWLHNL